jgi:hypothetical protein
MKILEGTKENYIYYLLKFTYFHNYKLFPLYEIIVDDFRELIKCKYCNKKNNVETEMGSCYSGPNFFCKYCEGFNEETCENTLFDKQNMFIFTNKYVLTRTKIKNNKIDNYFISPKKYKYKILWSKNIMKVNEQIKHLFLK